MWGSHSGDIVSLDKGRQSNTFHLNPQQISYHKFTVTVIHNNDFRILDNTVIKLDYSHFFLTEINTTIHKANLDHNLNHTT
jgi:hypothetical protein